MRKYSKITPEGTKDLLFEECVARRQVEEKIVKIFKNMGYNEVQTPAVEFADVFQAKGMELPLESMFKFTDYKGRLLALRPDSTMPIARMVGSRLKDATLPIRLYYMQKTYNSNESFSGRRDEIMQMGIELVGASGIRADLEVLTTAVRVLSSCVPDFRIELGQAEFFKELTSKLNLTDEEIEYVRNCIETKNYTAHDQFIENLPETTATTILKKLPRLFGDSSVIDEAIALCKDEISTSSLVYLKKLYDTMTDFGLKDNVIIDLGMVHRNEYYTGVIFRGYMQGLGDVVLSGGRYDNLLPQYGCDMPATGFGIDVDAVGKLLLMQNKVVVQSGANVLVHGTNGNELKAIYHAKELTDNGLVCEISTFETTQKAKEYAVKKGIARVDIVGDEIVTVKNK